MPLFYCVKIFIEHPLSLHVITKGKISSILHAFSLKQLLREQSYACQKKVFKRLQLLILDGHNSHSFIKLLELAILNQVSFVQLPAHR